MCPPQASCHHTTLCRTVVRHAVFICVCVCVCVRSGICCASKSVCWVCVCHQRAQEINKCLNNKNKRLQLRHYCCYFCCYCVFFNYAFLLLLFLLLTWQHFLEFSYLSLLLLLPLLHARVARGFSLLLLLLSSVYMGVVETERERVCVWCRLNEIT